MIRTVVALSIFAAVVCGLIIFRPFAETTTAVQPDPLGTPIEAEVTRAAPADVASLAEAALAAAPAVAPAPPAVVEAPRRVDVVRPNTDDTRLSDMTNNVLAELGFAGVEHVTTNSESQRQSTSNILAGIQAATGQDSVLRESNTLEEIVVAALRAGQSDDEINTLVNAAAAEGFVAVPEILVTSDGRVDTHVLLENIVTQAHIAAGGAAPAFPDTTPDNTQGLEVRVVQRASEAVQARFYTVQTGDSLGGISIRFFGSAEHYNAIFEANRGLLSSPDRIRVGQRLVIPNIEA